MPEIKLQHVISVSNEEKQFPAENLLKHDSFKKWKCSAGEKQASIIFQFEKASEISQIDIGNEASAFVEVLVGKSAAKDDDFQVIVVTSSLMNPVESRASQNPNRVRIFNSDQLSKAVAGQKWDRAKVVCTQPFNQMIPYGLSFIKFHTTPPASSTGSTSLASSDTKTASFGAFKLKSDTESGSIRTGSLFERNKPKIDAPSTPVLPTTGAAVIRAASRKADQDKVEKLSPAVTPSTSKADTSQSSMSSEDVSTSRAKMTVTKDDNRVTSSPPPTKKTKHATEEHVQSFDSLMRKVVFVLSGFENPERSNLRDQALEMGATYKPDWSKQCTHLICAFQNTPKYNLVLGKGRIVKKTWITDCCQQKKLLPWRQYRLGRAKSPDGQKSSDDETEDRATSSSSDIQRKTTSTDCKKKDPAVSSREQKTACDKDVTKSQSTTDKKSGDEQRKDVSSQQTDEDWDPFADDIGIESDCDTEEEIRRFEEMQSKKASPSKPPVTEVKPDTNPKPVASTSRQQDTETVYDASTDDDDAAAGNQLDEDGLPVLPNFFGEQTFLLSGKFSSRRTLTRYVIAYNGRLADYMGDDVKYVITEDKWDDTFDAALADNSGLIFVRPSWIYACHDAQKCLPYQKYAVVPP